MTNRPAASRDRKQQSRTHRDHATGGQNRAALGGQPASRKPAAGQPKHAVSHAHYLELARQAERVGDKVLSENYYQHAEHFYRMSQGETA